MRQVAVIIRSDRNNTSAPVMIAPITLVAAKDTASRITDVKTVPKIPRIRTGKTEHTQLRTPRPCNAGETPNNTARKRIAIPPATHKKAGVTVIVAVILSIAATKPKIMLAKIARVTQEFLLHPQLKFDIKSPPVIMYAKKLREVIFYSFINLFSILEYEIFWLLYNPFRPDIT